MDLSASAVTINFDLSNLLSLARNGEEAKLKMRLSELMEAYVELRNKNTLLCESNQQLRLENEQLKNAATGFWSDEKPTLRWSCYQFKDDKMLYCIGCWEREKRKSPTTRHDHGSSRRCTVCRDIVMV